MTTRILITKVLDSSSLARQILPHMESLGQAIGTRMQRLVPKDTWALHDTITSTTAVKGSRVITTVGFGSARVTYGLYVERGTSRMRAQPFARPALMQSRAGDLNYSGSPIKRHGLVTTMTTRRSRVRARGNL